MNIEAVGTLELAQIKEVGYGTRDVGRPVLYFTAELENGPCSLQILEQEEANKLIQSQHLYDVHDLNGRFCWVERTRKMSVFKRMWGTSDED